MALRTAEPSPASIASEAAWLAAWMRAEMGTETGRERSALLGNEPASACIRAFWDAVGHVPSMEDVIADPDPARGRLRVEALRARWRQEGEPGANAPIPSRSRLVEIDGNGFLLTDEDDDHEDPSVLTVIDRDATVYREWPSYLQRATAGIVTMIAGRFASVPVHLNGDPGERPMPYLAPGVRRVAEGVWLVPGGLEPDPSPRTALYHRLEDVVRWLSSLGPEDVAGLARLPPGPQLLLEEESAAALCGPLRRFEVRDATVWVGLVDGEAMWCRLHRGKYTAVVASGSRLQQRLAPPTAATSAPAAHVDAPPFDPQMFRATTEILIAVRGPASEVATVDGDEGTPSAVRHVQRMLASIARPLSRLVDQRTEPNAARLAECLVGWSPPPALPARARLISGLPGHHLDVADESEGDDDPRILRFYRRGQSCQVLPVRYAAYLCDLALRLVFTDGPHRARLALVVPPKREAIAGLGPEITSVAEGIWAIDPGPAAQLDARPMFGFVSLGTYVDWVAALDDRRATDVWVPRADRVDLRKLDLAQTERWGLARVEIQRAASPLLAVAFGGAGESPPEVHAVGRVFDAPVWIAFEYGRVSAYLDPKDSAAWVQRARKAGVKMGRVHSWQSQATARDGGLIVG